VVSTVCGFNRVWFQPCVVSTVCGFNRVIKK